MHVAPGEVDARGVLAGIDDRQTSTPLSETSRSNGSNAAVVVPMAARTRPQFGSRPNTAHLNRLLRATERPTSTASVSEAAPTTSTAMSCSDPSASRMSCWARSWHTAVTAAVNASGDGEVPDAPPASRTTVSLVDMHPSESSRSKVTRVAARRAASQVAPSTSASVVRTTSIVASAGASMPAPLAMPPTTNPSPCATACFGTVSVVMIASAATAPPSPESAACAARTPSSSCSAGSGRPISPVEQTTTSEAPVPTRSATSSAVRWVVAKPSGPV